MAICTPVVDEKPGLVAWPPPFTAKGVRVAPTIRNYVGHVKDSQRGAWGGFLRGGGNTGGARGREGRKKGVSGKEAERKRKGSGSVERKRTITATSSGVPGSTLHADCAVLDSAQCLMSAKYCLEAERCG